MPKTISKDFPLSEITLRRYEKPYSMPRRELIRKICLSVGLLQPGDSRDIVVDVMHTLLNASKDKKMLNSEDIKTNKKSLSFLSPQNIYQAMRQRATEMTASSPGVAEQYGEFKYLHYNQKVYQALQQSMSIIANRLSQQQHDMLLHNIQHPTRIRFALDQQGQLKGIAIILASGNPAYDSLAYQIVKEASYPPIPKSFNMHTTYHTYAIVLYYNGVPQDNFGVSPYLEGE